MGLGTLLQDVVYFEPTVIIWYCVQVAKTHTPEIKEQKIDAYHQEFNWGFCASVPTTFRSIIFEVMALRNGMLPPGKTIRVPHNP